MVGSFNDIFVAIGLIIMLLADRMIGQTHGVTEGSDITLGTALGVLAVYIMTGWVALAVDRRALLVSASIYVLVALAGLFSCLGAS